MSWKVGPVSEDWVILVYRSGGKYHRNLRFGPLVFERVRFAPLSWRRTGISIDGDLFSLLGYDCPLE